MVSYKQQNKKIYQKLNENILYLSEFQQIAQIFRRQREI